LNILEKIALKTKERVDAAKLIKPLEAVKEEAFKLIESEKSAGKETFRLEKSIKSFNNKGEMAFICEIKKASPSKGLIDKHFQYLEIAKEYEKADAAAISVLTEPFFFQGSNVYLNEISKNVQTPLLRKDFTIDEYQIYVAKLIGASSVLLIASLLKDEEIEKFIQLNDTLGLCSLVEAHSESEVVSALRAGARILGVNNRDLRTFDVDLNTALRLKKGVPDDVIFISESGIKTRDDVKKLQDSGVSGVLIGESLMRSENKAEMLRLLRGEK